MKPILYLMTLVLLTLSLHAHGAAMASQGPTPALVHPEEEAAAPKQQSTRWQHFKAKTQLRLDRWRDRLIYPRGWFFICLGIAALLAGGAFALVSYAILSTILTVGAIAAGVVALFFLARWVGYYWRY